MAGIKDIIATQEKAAANFDKAVETSEKKIFDEVVLLIKDLETTPKGNIKTSISNLKRVQKIRTQLSKIANNKEYLKAVADLVGSFDKIYQQQLAFYAKKNQSTRSAEKKKLVQTIARENTIESLSGAGLATNVLDRLDNMLVKAVTTGAKFSDLQDELHAYLVTDSKSQGALAKYAKTYAVTALSQYAGQNNKLFTEDLGTEWFEYVGSEIETTRPLCNALIKKRYIHKSEIPEILKGHIHIEGGEDIDVEIYPKTKLPYGMIEGTNADNFQVNVGGWNCRHQLIPVADAAVPENIRAKFDKKTQEEIAKKKAEEEKKAKVAELEAALSKYYDWNGVDKTAIGAAIKVGDIAELEAQLVSMHTIEEQLKKFTLLSNPKEAIKHFSVAELQQVEDAVAKKLSEFDAKGFSGQKLADKLQFEVDWVSKQKKYPTWQVAEQAYNKKLAEVQKDIALKSMEGDVLKLMQFKTSSKPYKSLLSDLTSAYQEGDVLKSQQLISKMTSEMNRLMKNRGKTTKNQEVQFDDDAYSKSRKDSALWFRDSQYNKEKIDEVLRKQTSEIWLSSSEIAKDAAFSYTEGSCYLNEPLRGMNYTGRKGNKIFKSHCNELTNMISRAKREFDYWIQRGDYENGFGARFNLNLYDYINNPQGLVGKIGYEAGFLSTGSTKHTGFSSYPVISNIYCPRGTEGLYCEPFSYYGYDVNGIGNQMNYMNGRKWDGSMKQKYFGREFETLLQRGTTFRITKAEYKNGKWYIDMEVIKQEYSPIV